MRVPSFDPVHHDVVRELVGTPIPPVRFDLRDLDHTTTPATDLDAFVNARWRAANPVPADRSCWDCFTILTERALQTQAEVAINAARTGAPRTHTERVVGDFWCSGMDGRAINALGLLPLREEFARIDALDTPEAIAAYLSDRHARGWGVLFGFEVAPDFENPSATIPFIFQGGLVLADRDAYFDATPHGAALLVAYRAHIAAMLARSGMPHPGVQAMANEVIAFETRLASASLSRQMLSRDIAQRYRRVTLDEADRRHPTFAWRAFFAAQGIAPPPYFSLATPSFHAAVEAMLREVPVATWRAYLRFHTIDQMAVHLDDATVALHHRFHGELRRGQRVLTPRWKRVLHAINAGIGEAMGQLYVARTSATGAKHGAELLVDRLRAALRIRIERLDWMGPKTRMHALRKLAAMRVKIGFPERWREWSALDTSAQTWCANILSARALNHRWMLAKLGKPVDHLEWPMLPQTVNAGYDPQRNEIVFPAVILQPPFFDPDADDALNLGGIGAVIAHEMTHAFDDQGSRFGANGCFENWWSDADRARFEASAQRLIDLTDGLPGTEERVDGRLTLSENIADLGGLAIACDVLQDTLAATTSPDPMHDGYSQSQRFFLNWAVIWRQNLTRDEHRQRIRTDPHAPAALRSNLAASHLGPFAEAFGCEPGDRMWRAVSDRIGLW